MAEKKMKKLIDVDGNRYGGVSWVTDFKFDMKIQKFKQILRSLRYLELMITLHCSEQIDQF